MEEQELVVLYAKVRKPLKLELEREAKLQRRTLASLVEVMLAEGLRRERLRDQGEVIGHAV
jgi:hypothetical protein